MIHNLLASNNVPFISTLQARHFFKLPGPGGGANPGFLFSFIFSLLWSSALDYSAIAPPTGKALTNNSNYHNHIFQLKVHLQVHVRQGWVLRRGSRSGPLCRRARRRRCCSRPRRSPRSDSATKFLTDRPTGHRAAELARLSSLWRKENDFCIKLFFRVFQL